MKLIAKILKTIVDIVFWVVMLGFALIGVFVIISELANYKREIIGLIVALIFLFIWDERRTNE